MGLCYVHCPQNGISQLWLPAQNSSGRGWFSLGLLCSRLFINKVNGKWRISVVYSSLAIHVFTASSTALDKSPFLPPNFSMVLNLSCFSSSFDSSTLILPILVTFYHFCARFARVRYCSNKQIAICQLSLSFPLSLYINPFCLSS